MSYPSVSRLTTAPTNILGASGTGLLTMQEVRDALGKSDDVTEDRRIANLVTKAYYAIEHKMNRAIITQTRTMTQMNFGDRIMLDFPPLATVTSVKYYDVNNAQQTLSSANYIVDTTGTFGIIQLKENQSWPSIYGRTDAVEVIFTCGAAVGSIYGEENIKEAIMQQVWGMLFKDEVNPMIDDLLAPYMTLAL